MLCSESDSRTIITRKTIGVVENLSDALNDSENPFTVIAVKQVGDDPFVLTCKPNGVEARIIKFTHV